MSSFLKNVTLGLTILSASSACIHAYALSDLRMELIYKLGGTREGEKNGVSIRCATSREVENATKMARQKVRANFKTINPNFSGTPNIRVESALGISCARAAKSK